MSEYLVALTLICGIVSIIVSFLILLKDKRSLLNQFLFLTFFFWAINVLLLGFIYGKLFDLEILNLIRDIEISFGIISGSFLLLSGLALKYGNSVQNKLLYIIIAITDLILIVIAIPNDYVDSAENNIISEPLGALSIFIIPGLLALLGISYFFRVYRISYERSLKRKIFYFILGSSFLVLGAVLLGLRNAIPIDLQVLRMISNIFYTLGPISVFWAFQGSHE